MATVVNRAPIEVLPKSKANAGLAKKFRSKKQADEYLATLKQQGVPASLFQEPTGLWEAVVRLKDGAGETHSERSMFHTEAEALAWAEKKEKIILEAREKKLGLAVQMTRLEDAVNSWYENVGQKLRGNKVIKYNKPKLVEMIGANRPLGDIDEPIVRAWRDKMTQEGYAPSTIANYRQILSGTFEYFISEKDFKGLNPCRRIKWDKPDNVVTPPQLSNTKVKRKRATDDGFDDDTRNEIIKSDEDALFRMIEKHSGKWLSDVVRFALETAARRSEIYRLEWEHIDFDEKVLHFTQEKNDWHKSNSEEKGRKIPIWGSLKAILEEVQSDPEKRTGRVFGGTLSSYTHSFSEVVKKLGWTDLTFHSLRKIATGRLSKRLSNVVELAQITGHADLQTLAKRYYGKDLDTLLEKLDANSSKSYFDESEIIKRLRAEARSEILEELRSAGVIPAETEPDAPASKKKKTLKPLDEIVLAPAIASE